MKQILFLIFSLIFSLNIFTKEENYVQLYEQVQENDTTKELVYSVIAQFFENGEPDKLYINKKIKVLCIYIITYKDKNKQDFNKIYKTIDEYIQQNYPNNIKFEDLKDLLIKKYNIQLIFLHPKEIKK